MKKIILGLALATTSYVAFAQELTSKKGETILPETGDWALSIDATPVLDYFGGFLSNAGASAPTWGYQSNAPLSITGKYFKDEKTAYRGMLRLGFGSTTNNAYSVTDGQSDPTVTVKDSKKSSYNNIVLGAGMEMRRGKTRLQGYYGGMFMFGMGGSKDKYSYGNAFSSSNTNPTRHNFGGNNPAAGTWTTENKMGSTMMIGLRGFIGAEYFILPKISIGAEFGWGLGFSRTGDGSTKTDSWDGSKSAVKSVDTKTGGTSMFGIDTDVNSAMKVPTGMLTLNMHF